MLRCPSASDGGFEAPESYSAQGPPQSIEGKHQAFGDGCRGQGLKVELAVTSDLKTIVCYHPSLEIPYEHTKPIPRPDPVNNKEENLDQVLKSRLNEKELKNSRGPTIEELSKMFYTTKHRWYPVGQYHRRRKNPNPPKDR
ncbi:39S ribosomal protein L42, mitochondrial [Willisornis vidua]|uniref:Large ribosomal subunit protein mL42 n=1 Tax=Willisornis vidua TaxID=1566151 RepID=A0ABQ9D5Q7_9PASS|nr:39S ribosomal protein L42, mitochondrial [Willisornis vidua]